MIEVSLDEPLNPSKDEKRRIYAIKNEKGFYLKISRPYWTDDLNKCLSEIKSFDCQVNRARSLLKTHEEYKNNKTKCLNPDLYLGFERLFIQEVDLVEKNNG